MILLICLLVGCFQDTSSTASVSDTVNLFDSGIVDTAVEPIIAGVGTWNVSNPELISDTCSIQDFQEVNGMVPEDFKIEESYLTFFKTDTTTCPISPTGAFVCDVTSLEESALGGAAAMQIETTMKGKIRSASEMDLGFDVIINSCEGVGCIAVELALTFPCPIILSATGSL